MKDPAHSGYYGDAIQQLKWGCTQLLRGIVSMNGRTLRPIDIVEIKNMVSVYEFVHKLELDINSQTDK